MGLFSGQKKKAKPKYKKVNQPEAIEDVTAPFPESEEYPEAEETEEIPIIEAPEEHRENSSEEKIAQLKEELRREEENLEKRKREAQRNTPQVISPREILDLIRANVDRNTELLLLLKNNYGV